MVEIRFPQDPTETDRLLEELPNRQAVFLIWPNEGRPMLGRTNVLRKRLKRMLSGLAGKVDRVEYQFTGSKLAAQFLVLDLARTHLGRRYRDEIRLRFPPYVKLVLTNEFPRTQVTAHLGKAQAVYFGPFRSKSTATRFESEFLDLFQLRRCQDNLAPRADHPGCMYGEMGRCLRPCQQAVGVEEYRGEADRVAEFLKTSGKSLAAPAESARERLSVEMDFEGASLMHQRVQRISEVLGLKDELARELEHLHAITITRAVEENAVELGWLRKGRWQGFSKMEFLQADGTAVSLDSRLRELATGVGEDGVVGIERMEQLALLSRWFYSSWCDGELILVDDWAKIPYRKLVNAVSRIAQGPQPHRPRSHS